MDFTTIRDHLKALESAVTGGDVPAIFHAVGDVSHDAGDVAGLFFASPPAKGAAKAADPVAKECLDACDRIEAACAGAAAAPPKAPAPKAAPGAPVGALWDGSILKALLANLPALIAIFRDLFKD